MIFYSDASLPVSTINLYQGFDGNSNSSSSFSLIGFYAIGSTGSKTTAFSWEGDQTLANNESLQFSTPLAGTNNLDKTGLDIVANSIFDPAAGEDTSVFMIPSTADPLGRTADSNFASGYFNIAISNGNPLTAITDANTKIDGRTQTAYSGNTNTGSVGSGGATVGTSASILPI